MAYREKAILVISGQILSGPFNPLPARSLLRAIERSLRDRDVALTRRVVTLAPKRAEAASLFLNAGFEIMPADDEDLQAAATISAILAENPVDEVVFMFGVPKPLQFLRSIAGKANRTLLTLEPLDDDLALNLEGALDFRELLSKEGVNCNVLTTKNWGVRGKASSTKAEKIVVETTNDADVDALCKTSAYDPEEFFKSRPDEWIAAVEEYLRKGEGYALAIDVVQELDKKFPGMEQVYLKKGAILCNPLCSESFDCGSRPIRYKRTDFGAYFYLAELKDFAPPPPPLQPVPPPTPTPTPEPEPESASKPAPNPVEAFAAAKDEWLPELEKFVLSSSGKCRAIDAIEALQQNFPKLRVRQCFWENRDAFYKLIRKSDVRLLEENGAPIFCHASHPDVRPASVDGSNLDLSIGAESPEKPDAAPLEFESTPPDPAKVAVELDRLIEASDLLRELTALYAERANLDLMGFDPTAALEGREDEIVARAKAIDLYLWPLQYRSAPNPTKEDYENAAKIYALLADSLRLLKQFVKGKEDFDAPVDVAAIQLAVNLQCLLKSALFGFVVDPGEDPVQRRTYELLRQFRELYAEGNWLENMRWEDRLPLDRIDSFKSRLERLKSAAGEANEKRRENLRAERDRAEAFEKLAEQCDRLDAARGTEGDPSALVETWNAVVELVSTLCRDCKEPYSSLKFRQLLYDVVDDVPDEVETTDEFGAVRQEIDLEKERETERANAASSAPRAEIEVETLAMRRVRQFYQGTKIVFVGGTPKKHIQDRLVDKLGFGEVIWESFDHGDSLDRFKSPLQDPDVKIFLAYIPWCSHKHSRELAKLVDEYGKTLVRVTRGTNPAQIADSICEQSSVPELESGANPELLQDDE